MHSCNFLSHFLYQLFCPSNIFILSSQLEQNIFFIITQSTVQFCSHQLGDLSRRSFFCHWDTASSSTAPLFEVVCHLFSTLTSEPENFTALKVEPEISGRMSPAEVYLHNSVSAWVQLCHLTQLLPSSFRHVWLYFEISSF